MCVLVPMPAGENITSQTRHKETAGWTQTHRLNWRHIGLFFNKACLNHLHRSSTVPAWVLFDLSKETVVHSARSSSSSSSSSFTHITQQPLSSDLKTQYSKERAAFRHRREISQSWSCVMCVDSTITDLHSHSFSYFLQCWLHFKVSVFLEVSVSRIVHVYLKVSVFL